MGILWGKRRAADSACQQPDDAISRAAIGPNVSTSDPALIDFLGLAGRNDAGVDVTETTALGLTAFYRGVQLIAGTIAGLPLKTYRKDDAGNRVEVASIFDNPGGSIYTPFEFKELVLVHLLIHGSAPLLHIYTQAGTLDSLFPLHPRMVTPEWEKTEDGRMTGRRIFEVEADGQTYVYTEDDLTYVMGTSVDGLQGLSPISVARNAIGTGIAADKAAARMFSSGLLIGGIVSSDEHLTEDDAKLVKAGLKAQMSGTKNAGDIAVVNASLKFSPWTMSAEDAQFLESRAYQVDEVARILGVPRELLSANGATSWGSGIQELVRGFARFTLNNWTSRIEERFSRLLVNPRFVEFEMVGLLQGTPAEEIDLLLRQIDGGLITVDEARAIRNLAPLTPAAEPDSDPAAISEEN